MGGPGLRRKNYKRKKDKQLKATKPKNEKKLAVKFSIERLISFVQKKKVIWRKGHPLHGKRGPTTVAWIEVVKNLGLDEENLKIRSTIRTEWTALSKRFQSERQKVPSTKSGSEATNYKSSWPHYEAISFLNENFRPAKSSGNIDLILNHRNESKDESDEESSDSDVGVPQNSTEVTDEEEESETTGESDDLGEKESGDSSSYSESKYQEKEMKKGKKKLERKEKKVDVTNMKSDIAPSMKSADSRGGSAANSAMPSKPTRSGSSGDDAFFNAIKTIQKDLPVVSKLRLWKSIAGNVEDAIARNTKPHDSTNKQNDSDIDYAITIDESPKPSTSKLKKLNPPTEHPIARHPGQCGSHASGNSRIAKKKFTESAMDGTVKSRHRKVGYPKPVIGAPTEFASDSSDSELSKPSIPKSKKLENGKKKASNFSCNAKKEKTMLNGNVTAVESETHSISACKRADLLKFHSSDATPAVKRKLLLKLRRRTFLSRVSGSCGKSIQPLAKFRGKMDTTAISGPRRTRLPKTASSTTTSYAKKKSLITPQSRTPESTDSSENESYVTQVDDADGPAVNCKIAKRGFDNDTTKGDGNETSKHKMSYTSASQEQPEQSEMQAPIARKPKKVKPGKSNDEDTEILEIHSPQKKQANDGRWLFTTDTD